MEVLSAMFPGRWIGMGDSVLWLPRSTDLTLLDFFFWGYIKNYIYMGTIQDLYHGKARISKANEQVTIFFKHLLSTDEFHSSCTVIPNQ